MRLVCKILVGLAFNLCISLPTWAEVRTERVPYRDGTVELEGYLAYDDAIQGKRPGVLVVHEWWGLNAYAERRARMLASLGYVAFAADLYGKGKSTVHPAEASEWAKETTTNVAAWQTRAQRGLDVLKANALVDTERLAAIGYCLGGSTVVEMAYAGAPLKGVVSFHGALPLMPEGTATPIRTRILVAHGAEDSFLQPEQIAKFQTSLTAAGADWQMIYYGGARHSFTNPDAGSFGMEGIKYDAHADVRSWDAMQQFFDELFTAAGH